MEERAKGWNEECRGSTNKGEEISVEKEDLITLKAASCVSDLERGDARCYAAESLTRTGSCGQVVCG
jgi:hypothetical protein